MCNRYRGGQILAQFYFAVMIQVIAHMTVRFSMTELKKEHYTCTILPYHTITRDCESKDEI